MISKTLQRKDGSSFEDISPITGAECVTYNSSNVKEELDYILSLLGNMITSADIDSKIAKACSDLYDKVLGTTDHDSVNSAYDTLKEVADYLSNHGNVVQGIQNDISNIKSTIEGLAAVSKSGSYNDLADTPVEVTTSKAGLMSAADKAKLDKIQDNSTKVEASSTNGNIKINGNEVNVYTLPTLSPSDVKLDKVGNYKAVSTEANQGLTDLEKQQARDNIGASDSASAFSGSYNDLTDKPVNATTSKDGFMASTDKAKLDTLAPVAGSSNNGYFKINGVDTRVYALPALTPSDVQLGNVGNYKAVSTIANQGLTEAEKAAARANIGASSSSDSFSGDYNDLTNKPTTATESADGLMSAADKKTLNNLSTKVTNVTKSDVNGNILVDGKEVKVYTPETISNATTSKAGLMSAEDKAKLDGLNTSKPTPGTIYNPADISFTNSTYYSLDSSGVNKYYTDNGITFVCMKVTCNKLVIPQADTVVATFPKPVLAVEFDNVPSSGESQYPPINCKIKDDGSFTIVGGASGCTYNVYVQYGYNPSNNEE